MGVFNWLKKKLGAAAARGAKKAAFMPQKPTPAESAWEAMTGTSSNLPHRTRDWASIEVSKHPWGHGGGAVADRDNPDFSDKNVSQWESLTQDEHDRFLYFNEPLFVHSTFIMMAQYFPDRNLMYFTFQDGGEGSFGNFSAKEAEEFLYAISKGIWVWDHCLVRGEGNQGKTQKPWVPGKVT
jgi:hypothetical protein